MVSKRHYTISPSARSQTIYSCICDATLVLSLNYNVMESLDVIPEKFAGYLDFTVLKGASK